MRIRSVAAAAFIWSLSAAVSALAQPGVSMSSAATAKPAGYLTPAQRPDSLRLLGPPPADGSGAKAGDLATYRATRSLQDSPRWMLATRDAELSAATLLKNFSCALGVRLEPKNAPTLYRLLARVDTDAEAAVQSAKATYKRPRPFVENHDGPICVPAEDWLKSSYSYPSGHSTVSWTAGLILAAIAPDRATEVVSRARSYGESRVVCGVHYPSDIQAGRVAASAVFDALQASPAFKADVARARRELVRLRAVSRGRADPAECAVEAEASAQPVY